MMRLETGDIVLLKFPFTDTVQSKKRPAIVLFDTEDGDIIVARVTSKLYETQFDALIEDWKSCGLKLPSVVRVHKIATLEKSLVDKVLGNLTDTDAKKVRETIKNKAYAWL